MRLKKYYIIGVILLFISNYSIAQIFAQGKNINQENIFSLTAELVPKPMDPGKYHASITFYGQRRDISWYLKDGVEHKVFGNIDEFINYMEDNGWFYLQTMKQKSYQHRLSQEKYLFRKSMEQLAREQVEQARNSE